uniref:Isoform Short of Hyaluronan and proteoglycan link protein 1 n=1 Tax=Rattus norvegicus TaxID=10116 RepID=P03994-2|nr:link protein (0.8 kd) [Rattus sp.]
MRSLLFLVLISVCRADHLSDSYTPDQDRVIHIQDCTAFWKLIRGRQRSSASPVGILTMPCCFPWRKHYTWKGIKSLKLPSLAISDRTSVVFPYFPRLGRYNLNFHEARQACLDQDAVIASFDQLYDAWRGGLDWCNAGWLSDGSVQYPITKPREPCGGQNTVPGVRNYGFWDKDKSRYDVFCFTSNFNGRFYYLIHPTKLTYDEAVQACLNDGAQIAKVGQIFAAWKLLGYDRCDAGWLADGSVRYPISRPRRRCSPTEAAVRFVGFPDKKHKLYGVYCFRAYN